MITIEDGVPIVAGRRFPWVKQVCPPNEHGALSFELMMENGWTAKVYFFPGRDECAVTSWSHLGVRRFWAGPITPHWPGGGMTAEECLVVLDEIASTPTHR